MELLFFYLPGCPYCRRAEELIEELLRENPKYLTVRIRRIDETAEPGFAAQYDYWRVPCFFLGDRKLYEAGPGDSPEKMRLSLNNVFRAAFGERPLERLA